MVDIDSEALFNGAAALLATVAALYFVFNVAWPYSPVSAVALVVAGLAGVFALTQRATDYQVVVLGYGTVVTVAVGLFLYLVGTFDAGDAATVGGLLAMAAVLFALRSRLDEAGQFVTGRYATYAFAGLAALAAVVLLVDVATGGLTYELQPAAQVEYVDEPRNELTVGTVVATNPTPFPEPVEAPAYAVCAAGNWSRYAPPSDPGEPDRSVRIDAHVDDGYDEHVLGYGTKTYPVRLHLHGANLTGETFPVERTDACPAEDAGEPYVALFEGPADRPYRYAL